jgi:23S rRNA (cytosine1962-C5)-methyltransferase
VILYFKRRQKNAEGRNILNSEISELLKVNFERIEPYLFSNEITAYRLINSSYRLPVSVDIYQNNAVIHVFSRTETELLKDLERALSSQLHINCFFYKNRTKETLNLPVSASKKIIQPEYGHQFMVNLSEYLDTGLFLDHRETRRWLAGLSHTKTVLNTFAYSGSFGVYAAAGGATKTFSVDISRVYCNWIRENLELNNLSLESNWIFKMDTLEFFRYAKKKQLIFDIIIIDPPTFSKNKGQSFSVQKDHPALVNGALELLSDSGFILFSTNFKEFKMQQKDLRPSRVEEKMDTIPPDFAGSQSHRCFVITKK